LLNFALTFPARIPPRRPAPAQCFSPLSIVSPTSRTSGVPVECLERENSQSPGPATSFRTECAESASRSSLCSTNASDGRSGSDGGSNGGGDDGNGSGNQDLPGCGLNASGTGSGFALVLLGLAFAIRRRR